jgi:hypothetical protein
MSDQFDCPYASSASSEAECPELPEAPQKKRKGGPRPRPPRNEFKAWVGETEIKFEFDACLSPEARTTLLKEKLQDRLGNEKPNFVHAYVALVDSSEYSGLHNKYSFPITFYIQTRNTTVFRLQSWLSDDVVLTPMKGGLCGNDRFDTDMKKPAPWVVIPLFSTLKLNNAGKAAKKVLARQFHCDV